MFTASMSATVQNACSTMAVSFSWSVSSSAFPLDRNAHEAENQEACEHMSCTSIMASVSCSSERRSADRGRGTTHLK